MASNWLSPPLQVCLSTLSRLHHLKTLDLFGNPVAEEQHYRLRVIAAVPSLEILDNLRIKDEERVQAARLSRRGGAAAITAEPAYRLMQSAHHRAVKSP